MKTIFIKTIIKTVLNVDLCKVLRHLNYMNGPALYYYYLIRFAHF